MLETINNAKQIPVSSTRCQSDGNGKKPAAAAADADPIRQNDEIVRRR